MSILATPLVRSHVFVGSETGLIKAVDLTSGTFSNCIDGPLRVDRENEITSVCFHGSGTSRTLLTSVRKGNINTYSCADKKFTGGLSEIPILNESYKVRHNVKEGVILRSVTSCGERLVAAGFEDGSVNLCEASGAADALAHEPPFSLAHTASFSCGGHLARACPHPDTSHLLATGGRDNHLKVWDLATMSSAGDSVAQPVFRAKNQPNTAFQLAVPVWVTDIAWLSAAEVAVSTAYHTVVTYDTRSGRRKPVLSVDYTDHSLTALCPVPGAGGRQVVAGSAKGSLALIDLRKRGVARAYKGVAGAVRYVRTTTLDSASAGEGPSRSVVASCGLDRFLHLHDVQSGRHLVPKIYLKSRLNCLVFNGEPLRLGEQTDRKDTRRNEKRGTAEGGEGSADDGDADDVWDGMERVEATKRRKR